MSICSKVCTTITCGFVAVAASAGVVRYVSPDATGAEDEDFSELHPGLLTNALAQAKSGTSWEDGDIIILLPGTYDCSDYPETEADNRSCLLLNAAYLTVKGSTGNRDDVIIQGGGVEKHMRAFRLYNKAMIQDLTVKGFGLQETVIKGSDATRNLFIGGGPNVGPTGYIIAGGAAICLNQVRRTQNPKDSRIRNCAFLDCQAGSGGAIYSDFSTLVQDCRFANNRFDTDVGYCGGGAVHGVVSSNCTFVSCYDLREHDESTTHATDHMSRGGAVYGSGSCCMDCTFTGCAAYNGSAIASLAMSSTSYSCTRCVFTNNVMVGGGNGVVCGGTFDECLFADNRGKGSYGVTRTSRANRCLFTRNVSNESILNGDGYNCLLVSNRIDSTSSTAGIVSSGTICNCTIMSNSLVTTGTTRPHQYVLGTSSVVYNSLIADNEGAIGLSYGSQVKIYNTVATTDKHVNTPATNFTVDANAGRAIVWGTDPIWGIPGMPTGINGRQSLKGAGTNVNADGVTFWTATDVDYAGKPRLREETVVDLGCYTYVPSGLMLLLR